MEISIPNDVQFKTKDEIVDNQRAWGSPLCFRHAVTRALLGQDIHTKLLDDHQYQSCMDCDEAKRA